MCAFLTGMWKAVANSSVTSARLYCTLIFWRVHQGLSIVFSPKETDGFNFKLAQYRINKIFELTKSCIWAISKWMCLSGNWTSCRAILVWNHTCDCKLHVWFQPKLHSIQFNYELPCTKPRTRTITRTFPDDAWIKIYFTCDYSVSYSDSLTHMFELGLQ